ncbi:MAG: class I SAM-dependent methyltransferase [Desulfobacteraceae bacterium]|nr:class I SAM-dependent methyltransferase [Desulfobacteraceae bacterium]
MPEKYFNEGWFGKHPTMYEIGSFFIALLRRKAAKKMGKKKLKIIDIATGTGAHAYELAKLGHEVVGIDLDKKMLVKARRKTSKKLKLSFLFGDGTKLPFKANEFDVATISFAMHDVPAEIGVKILKEAKRVIKKDGFIFIVDYNQLETCGAKILYTVAISYESPNYKPFVKRNFSYYLKETGLKIVKKDAFLGAVQMTKIR